MKVKIERNGFFFKANCFFCDGGFDLDDVIAKVYFDDGHWRDVCPDCLKVGPLVIKENLIRCAEEIRERAKTCAEELREEAKAFEDLASQEIDCPTWDEFQEEKRKTEEEFKETM